MEARARTASHEPQRIPTACTRPLRVLCRMHICTSSGPGALSAPAPCAMLRGRSLGLLRSSHAPCVSPNVLEAQCRTLADVGSRRATLMRELEMPSLERSGRTRAGLGSPYTRIRGSSSAEKSCLLTTAVAVRAAGEGVVGHVARCCGTSCVRRTAAACSVGVHLIYCPRARTHANSRVLCCV